MPALNNGVQVDHARQPERRDPTARARRFLPYNRKHISDEEMKEKGAKDPGSTRSYTGQDWRLERLAHPRMWFAAAADRPSDPNDIPGTSTAAWDACATHRDMALKYWASGAESDELMADKRKSTLRGRLVPVASMTCRNRDTGHRYYDPPQRLRLAGNACSSSRQPDGGLRELIKLQAQTREPRSRWPKARAIRPRSTRPRSTSGKDPEASGLRPTGTLSG